MSTSAANRPVNGRINVHEPSDYPIILGDSLKNETTSRSRYLRFRYNWEPANGFSNQVGTLKCSDGQVHLAYHDEKLASSTYEYDAAVTIDTNHDDDTHMAQMALVFDPSKSVYVLEQISQSFDMNLTSAHDHSREEVRQHKPLGTQRSKGRPTHANGAKATTEQDENEADPTNPFDFRHFLSEAKDNAEKAAQPAGNRTPVPGSRTPMSGISSPSSGAGRFLSANTPQFRPTPTSAPLPKKTVSTKPAAPVVPKRQNTARRKPAAAKPVTSQPLSNEVVSDSSDEDTQDTITVSQPARSRIPESGHNRNVSSLNLGHSPSIVASNGLEIDYGSPPPEPNRRAIFDLEAFRTQTNTPTLNASSKPSPHSRSQRDIEMRDRSEGEEDDDDHEVDEDVDADMDQDVEELVLDSPRSKRSDERRHEIEKAPSPPTPLPPPPDEDEDEDDDGDYLAAELEAALEQDDDGVPPPANIIDDDDESEISEEE